MFPEGFLTARLLCLRFFSGRLLCDGIIVGFYPHVSSANSLWPSDLEDVLDTVFAKELQVLGQVTIRQQTRGSGHANHHTQLCGHCVLVSIPSWRVFLAFSSILDLFVETVLLMVSANEIMLQ